MLYIASGLWNSIVEIEKIFLTYILYRWAWFNLSSHVDSQNSHVLVNNPHEIMEQCLHNKIICIWCAISCKHIITNFFHNTINADCYCNELIFPFLRQLSGKERRKFLKYTSCSWHTNMSEKFGVKIYLKKTLGHLNHPMYHPLIFICRISE